MYLLISYILAKDETNNKIIVKGKTDGKGEIDETDEKEIIS